MFGSYGLKFIPNFAYLREENDDLSENKNNRSPKGNMWSAIPVTLLYVIVKWSERKQGSGPEGDEVL